MCRFIVVYSLLLLHCVTSLAQTPPHTRVLPLDNLIPAKQHSLLTGYSPTTISPNWIRTYNAFLAPATDAAVDIAVDPAGNVFVTGYSDSLKNGFDIMTIKYAENGRQVWKKRYNSGVGVADYPVAVIPHADGSVSICGYADLEPGLSELLTLRYDTNGQLLWAVRYAAGGSMRPLEAITDEQNGLIITSGLTFPDGGSDAVVMRYSQRGILSWDYTYSPAGVQRSFLNTLYADEFGNVYAGGSHSVSGSLRMLLVKLTPEGQTVWSKEFDIPGRDEMAIGVCALPNNSVCIAGNSLSDDNDMRFIGLNSAGETLWQRQVNFEPDDRLVGVTSNESGVFATGYSQTAGFSKVKTFHLNTLGELLWAEEIHDAYNTYPTDITVDQSGNSMVVGFREKHVGASGIIAAKYSPSGELIWSETLENFGESHHEGRAISAGKNGEVFLAGYGFSAENGWDMLTYAFNTSGEQLWLDVLNEPATSREQGVISSLDSEDHLITLANSFSGEKGWDALVTKHTSTGELIWSYRLDHFGTDDEAIDLLVGEEAIFVLTQAVDEDGLQTAILTGLSLAGNGLFHHELAKKSGWNLRPVCLTTDMDETLYVAASEYQIGSSSVVITALGEDGSVSWRYASSENSDDELTNATALAVNEYYLAIGGTISGSANSQKVGITLLNDVGQFQWQRAYQGNADYMDELNDLVFREDHAVVFAATVYNNGYNRDIVAGCYALDGSLLWLDELNGSGNNNDLAYEIGITSVGEVFLIGRTFRGAEGNDIVLLKYDASGNRTGEWFVHSAPLFNDDLYTWTLDAESILIAAHSPDNSIQIAEVDFYGQILDQYSVIMDGESQQSLHSLHQLSSQEILLNGSLSVGGWSALAIASIRNEPTGISVVNLPESFQLMQNYPNPFNPSTHIEFSLASPSNVKLEVLNPLGKVVAILADEDFAPGTHNITWQADSYASGVYLYRMRIGTQAITRRMLLLR